MELVENFFDASVLSNDVRISGGSAIVKVKESLKRNIAFWEHIGASRFICDTNVDGYNIPFIYTPPAASFCNNRSAIQHTEFVEQAISDLLLTGSGLNVVVPLLWLIPCQFPFRLMVRKGSY